MAVCLREGLAAVATKPELIRFDPAPQNAAFDSDEFQRWLANIVDQYNDSMQRIEDALP